MDEGIEFLDNIDFQYHIRNMAMKSYGIVLGLDLKES